MLAHQRRRRLAHEVLLAATTAYLVLVRASEAGYLRAMDRTWRAFLCEVNQ